MGPNAQPSDSQAGQELLQQLVWDYPERPDKAAQAHTHWLGARAYTGATRIRGATIQLPVALETKAMQALHSDHGRCACAHGIGHTAARAPCLSQRTHSMLRIAYNK